MRGSTIAEVGDRLDGDLLGEDPRTSALDAASQATAVVAETLPTNGKVHLSYGDEDMTEYVAQLAADHLIHGWDLAAATGGDTDLDPDLVADVAAWFAEREDSYRSAGAVAGTGGRGGRRTSRSCSRRSGATPAGIPGPDLGRGQLRLARCSVRSATSVTVAGSTPRIRSKTSCLSGLRQSQVGGDGREVADVVAGRHRNPTLDGGLLYVDESVVPHQLGAGPLQLALRAACRRATTRRRPPGAQLGRPHRLLDAGVGQEELPAERGERSVGSSSAATRDQRPVGSVQCSAAAAKTRA